MKDQRGFAWPPALIIIFGFLGLLTIGYFALPVADRPFWPQKTVWNGTPPLDQNVNITPPEANIKDITQNSNTNSSQDSTTGWKTYTDSANKFSLKYPSDLSPEQPHNNIISFFNASQDKSISIFVKDSAFSVNRITRPDATGNEIAVPLTELTKVTVGDQDGYRFRSGVLSCSSTQVWTGLGTSKTLVTSFQRCEDGTNVLELDYSTQNQILATFKFTK